MSQHDRAEELQELFFKSLVGLVPENEVQLVQSFAEDLGVTVLSYGPMQREYRMSDGENYSMQAITQHLGVH